MKTYNIQGEELTKEEICQRYNIGWSTINNRLHNGWEIERAVTQPVAKRMKTETSMWRKFTEATCTGCGSWGGHYSEDKWGVEIWEECIFCNFGRYGFYGKRYQSVDN